MGTEMSARMMSDLYIIPGCIENGVLVVKHRRCLGATDKSISSFS